jgi:hypothetical protein
MSFGVAAAMGLTGVAATMMTGAIYGGLTTVGMNVIQGNDPFDNIGQGILIGGIGGAFSSAANAATGAATAGEGAVANATNAANTGNIASDVVLNSTSVPAGTLNPVETYGLDPMGSACPGHLWL